MNKIKIILVLLTVVAGIGGATYYFTRPSAEGVVTPSKSTIKEDTVKKSIQEKIEQAPNNRFCIAAYDEVMKQINLFFTDEPTNLQTYTMMLQGEYTRKFVEQANYVFDHTQWNSTDIATIKKEVKRCTEFSPSSDGLKAIRNVLTDYDKLFNYNQKVTNACKQKPKCLQRRNLLYTKDDQWNIAETQQLISSVPNPTSKVQNSPIYKGTRKSEVEKQLKYAHHQFITDKMNCAEKEAKGYNYNPARHKDWEVLGQNLYIDLNTYWKQWEERKSVDDWQRQVASWEIYALQQ